MLRDEADLLQQHDRDLFSKKFSEHPSEATLQLNQKDRPSKNLLKMARKNKSHFGIPLQRHRGGVLGNSIGNSSSTKDMGNQGKKIFDGNYRPACAQQLEHNYKRTKERNKEEHKGNMREYKGNIFQHVLSIFNSHRRSG